MTKEFMRCNSKVCAINEGGSLYKEWPDMDKVIKEGGDA